MRQNHRTYSIEDVGNGYTVLESLTNLTHLKIPLQSGSIYPLLTRLTNLTHLDLKSKTAENETMDLILHDPYINLDYPFSSLIKLKSLSLPSNRVTFSENILTPLTNLTSLDLSYSYVVDNNMLRNFTNLTELNLGNNYIVTDETVSQLTKLVTLNLKNNSVISNRSLSCLTNFTNLNLRMNPHITDETIKELTKLKELNLACNDKITDRGVSTLTRLAILSLTDNNTVTHHSLTYLTNLEELYLNYNNAVDLSKVFDLPNLKHLTCAVEENDEWRPNSDDLMEMLKKLGRLHYIDHENVPNEEMNALKYLVTSFEKLQPAENLNNDNMDSLTAEQILNKFQQLIDLPIENGDLLNDVLKENIRALFKLHYTDRKLEL